MNMKADRVNILNLENNPENKTNSESETENEIGMISILTKCWQIMQVWPLKNKTPEKLRWQWIIVWSVSIYCILAIVSLVIKIMEMRENMDGVAETIDHVTACISATYRYLHLYYRGDEYAYIFYLMRKRFMYYSPFESNKKESIQKYYSKVKSITITYTILMTTWMIQDMLTPLIKYCIANFEAHMSNDTNKTIIPFPNLRYGYFPMDTTKSPGGPIFYAIQMCAFILFTIQYTVTDHFLTLALMLSIGQFRLIKVSVESIKELVNNNEDISSSEDNLTFLNGRKAEEVKRRLGICIKHHGFMTTFNCLIDDLANQVFLIDYIHAIISLAFLLLEFTIRLTTRSWNKLLSAMQFLLISIFHMLIYDTISTQLMSQEEELLDSIADVPWYRFPWHKNDIILSCLKAKKPHKVTGGKAFYLSLELFTKTMRIIFSYFTFLLQLRFEK